MIIRFIGDYLLRPLLVVLPFFIAFLIYRITQYRKKGSSLKREVAVILFGIYMTVILAVTVVNTNFVSGWNGRFGFWSFINLVPFKSITETFALSGASSARDIFNYVINVFGNVAMLMPFGFFLPLLWDIKLHKAILFGVLLSLLIEIMQLPFIRGSDIDDIILNTLGVIIGYTIYALLRKNNFIKLFKKTEKTIPA